LNVGVLNVVAPKEYICRGKSTSLLVLWHNLVYEFLYHLLLFYDSNKKNIKLIMN
jgi:hypothetical protein